MMETKLRDPVFIRTGTQKEIDDSKTYLESLRIYNTIGVWPIADTGQYLMVAQNRYPVEVFIKNMRRTYVTREI